MGRCCYKYYLAHGCQGGISKNKTSFLDQGPIFAKSEGAGLQKLKCPKHFSLWDSFVNKCEGKKKTALKKTKGFTSTDVQFDVISFVVGNEILWAGFLGSVVEFADTLILNEVEALAQGLFFCI